MGHRSGSRSRAPPRAGWPGRLALVDDAGMVTVTVWRYEMGQGSRTTMAQVVAEELDVEWASVRVRHALDDDVEMSKQTGGSETMRSSWTLLRDAGALARAALLEAAAARHDVPVAKCRTEAGQVLLPSGETVGYGELVARRGRARPDRASRQCEAGEAATAWSGIDRPASDGHDVVTGRAVFASDVRRPGMAFAVLARPPHTGATLAGADEKAARSVEGVLAVHRVEAGVAVLATSTWAAFKVREALQPRWRR